MLGATILLLQEGGALAFERGSLTSAAVTLTVRPGVTREFPLASYDGGTAFLDLKLSADRRFAGFEVEESAAPSTAPMPLTLVIAGPTTELRIAGGQGIRRWSFANRAVRVCIGPAHGPQSATCRAYRLPE